MGFEQANETRYSIIPYTLKAHLEAFNDPVIDYLSVCSNEDIVGFFILAKTSETDIEFRRLVISIQGMGYGQRAIPLMETYCRTQFNAKRIWLDVFADNSRAQHVYIKLGYQAFDTVKHNDKILVLMEKIFPEK